ncbi:MAG: SpoIIE family protein phosphatase [bacterium]
MKLGLSAKFTGLIFALFAFTAYGVTHFHREDAFDRLIEERSGTFSRAAKSVDVMIADARSVEREGAVEKLDWLAGVTGARVLLTDPRGLVVYDSEDESAGIRGEWENPIPHGQRRRDTAVFYLVRESESGTEYIPLDEKPGAPRRGEKVSLRVIAPLRGKGKNGGFLIIMDPLENVRGDISMTRYPVIIFMSVWFVVAAALFWFFVNHSVLVPARQLTDLSRSAARKDFSGRVEFTSGDEIALLGKSFNTMMYNVENFLREADERNEGLIHLSSELEARNQDLQRRQRLIDSDLKLAHSIQQELLPRAYPQIEGVRIAAVTFPVGEVGGDCFDVYKLGERKLGAFIGDVSGKGISAALVMAMATILFSQLKDKYPSPDEILTKVNEVMYRHFGSQHSIYLTCFFFFLDLNTMTMSFSTAGHTPPILHRRETGEVTFLEAEGFGLGMFPGVRYERKTMKLAPGDKIILYTDGAVESRNEQGAMFGTERLVERVKFYSGANSYQLTHNIVEDVGEFAGATPRLDDLTILVVELERTPDG